MTTVGGVTYEVQPQVLSAAASSTDATADSLKTLIEGVRSYVVSLEENWQGIAYQQFQQLMTNYDSYAAMLDQALRGISSGLRGNYLNYTESEQRNLANIQTVNLPTANFS